jgi:glycosidase
MHKHIGIFLPSAVGTSALAPTAKAITITRVEPANWWVGMKNRQLQLMVYGPGISNASLLINYPGVTVTEIAKTGNPNYLFVYIDIAHDTKHGFIPLQFTRDGYKLTFSYPLKARTDSSGARGFSAADVLYLLIPDRFANGNPAIDNWDDVPVDRENPNARHGGDLAGIAGHLDYLKDLGITTVWLNPVQENKMPGGSYHGYAITDFYKVDQRLGSNEEFCTLIKTIHRKGMKMVMDMVFNHCGSAHWWMADLPSKNWLNDTDKHGQTNHITSTVMDIHAPKTERDTFVNGWFSDEMPDLNQGEPNLATYLIQNSIWWIEYARVDGIRQDTYPYIDFDFLARWCKAVQEEYPDFNIVGETWYTKSSSSAWWQQNSKLNTQNSYLKTVMDFSLTFIMQKGFDSKSDNGYLDAIFEDLAEDFVYPDPYSILIFLDNHDMGRFNREGETDLIRYKQAMAFLLTTRGIPQVYYGTEILMTGAKEEGDGALRRDFPGGWPGDAANAFLESGRTAMQNEAWGYTQKLLQWRKTSAAVTQGTLIHYKPKSGVYVYARIKGSQTVMVMLSSAPTDETVPLERYSDVTANFTHARDVITGQIFKLDSPITMPAKSQFVLELGKATNEDNAGLAATPYISL